MASTRYWKVCRGIGNTKSGILQFFLEPVKLSSLVAVHQLVTEQSRDAFGKIDNILGGTN